MADLDGIVPFTSEEVEASLPARFERVAAALPERRAWATGERQLSYDQLNREANRVAHLILGLMGPGPGRVALLLGQEGPQAAAILGILKAGKGYVPLNPEDPPARGSAILADAGADLILTDEESLPATTALTIGERRLIDLDHLPGGLGTDNPGLEIAAGAMAYVLYTSGSTGQPKGVVNNHRNLLHYALTVRERLRVFPGSLMAHLVPATFSYMVASFFGALLNGAVLMPFDLKRRGFPALARWLSEAGIEILCTIPSTLRQVMMAVPQGTSFPGLRTVVSSGEPFFLPDIQLVQRHLPPACVLMNCYGSTEALYVSDFAIPRDFAAEAALTGYPVAGKRFLILDEEGREAPPGEVGEIAVQSMFLSPGYWQRPDLSAAAFLPAAGADPNRLYRTGDLGSRRPDGCIEPHGRKDSMIKVSSHRVELGEIENKLRSWEEVQEAVVVARDEGRGKVSLIAYVVPRANLDELGMRMYLADLLPAYMIPNRLIILDRMPLNPSGKVDRRSLPEPEEARRQRKSPILAPRDDRERRLVGIFEGVLRVSPIGIRDDFFELGGDSLTFLWLFAEIEKEFGVALPMEDLIQHSTIEHLARVLQVEESGRSEDNPSRPKFRFGREEYWAQKLGGRVAVWAAKLPYEKGARFIASLSRLSWLRRLLFGRHLRLVQDLLSAVPELTAGNEDAAGLSLACNLGYGWRCLALSQSSPFDFARWVKITGYDAFAAAQAGGRGVILVFCHSCLSLILPLALKRAGAGEMMAVARFAGLSMAMGLVEGEWLAGMGQSNAALFASQVFRGKQVLGRGGTLLIAADGFDGAEYGQSWPFLGRLWPFRPGFAELALETGAPVIPVSVTMERDGRVVVSFQGLLAIPDAPRESQIESMIGQFADFLEHEWRRGFWNIRRTFLRYFLSRPTDRPDQGEESGRNS